VHDDGMNKEAPTIAYWPTSLAHFEGDQVSIRRFVVFAVRTPRAGSESLMKDIRQAVWSVDSNLPLTDIHTQDYYYQKSISRTSFTLVMMGIAAGIALLLGVVGLYGVIAYSASQRTREIGIRIALGAQRKTITSMFVRQGLMLAGGGIVGGLLLAFAATQLLKSLLFNVSPLDPVTYVLACIALCGAASLASYIPSRRTVAVNPVDALRAE
jgi:ABC-type antimicrobial peptide transport system permease subunit